MVTEIKRLCKINNISTKALEERLHFGNGSIRRWDECSPSVDKVFALSQFFGVPMEYFFGYEAPTAPINETETRLLSAWRQADEKTRKHVAVELEDYGFSYAAREKEAI